MEIDQIFIRIGVFSVAGVICLFSEPLTITYLFIYLGQAHFFLAYWYKFERIPSLLRSHFFLFWAICTCIAIGAGMSGYISFELLLSITGIAFLLHFIIDEVSLCINGLPVYKAVLFFTGLVAVFTLHIYRYISSVHIPLLLLLTLSVVSFIITLIMIRSVLNKHLHGYFAYYVFGLECVSIYMLLQLNTMKITYALGFIILGHIFIWYSFYYRKLKYSQKQISTYLTRVILVNIIVALFWVAFIIGNPFPGHRYFFTEYFYYLWACMHIVFSVIPKNFSFRQIF